MTHANTDERSDRTTDSTTPLAIAVESALRDVYANREKYLRAWIAETSLAPSECELVEDFTDPRRVVICVRRREPAAASPPRVSPAESRALEMAWVIIANVSGGDWTLQSNDWQHAAARWRDEWTPASLDTKDAPPPTSVTPERMQELINFSNAAPPSGATPADETDDKCSGVREALTRVEAQYEDGRSEVDVLISALQDACNDAVRGQRAELRSRGVRIGELESSLASAQRDERWKAFRSGWLSGVSYNDDADAPYETLVAMAEGEANAYCAARVPPSDESGAPLSAGELAEIRSIHNWRTI